jgi:chemotaxis protein methyltransferase CheR
VSDPDCTAFLQWALPQLQFRWAGFRKVRRQVCRRVGRRLRELGLDGFSAYRVRLEADPAEWRVLDGLCRITISRFFRDRGVFEVVRREVLPEIAAKAREEGRAARAWSAGCASGEEPYTLKILWDAEIVGPPLHVVASDADPLVLGRARRGCYDASSLRELEPSLIERGFDRIGPLWCVRPEHRDGVEFLARDLRAEAPEGPFDLILCRYLAFTYFADALQRRVLTAMLGRLRPHGFLVIGTHEHLPDDPAGLDPVAPQIFRNPRPPWS